MSTFSIITLGCKVNAYESQWYREQLLQRGLIEAEPKQSADVIIINTCAVTNTAGAKSRQKIHAARKQNPDALICVVGCYVQTEMETVSKWDEVDLIIGTKGKRMVPDRIMNCLMHRERTVIHQSERDYDMDVMPIYDFKQTRAYLKIQDGCNQFCAYCIIPYARGKERSLPLQQVIANASQLVASGHHELVLSGIHTGRYHDGTHNLSAAVRALLQQLPDLWRLRISSIEITEVSDELIALMREEPRIARHLHIPLQAGSDAVLQAMHRPYTMADFEKRIRYIRSQLPDISISTDVIVGFPNETEQRFDESVRNIRSIGFSFLHVFPFSCKKGTAAEAMKPQCSGAEKRRRVKELTKVSEELYNTYKRSMLNHTVTVLVEREEDGVWKGHTSEYLEICIASPNDLSHTMVPVTVSCVEQGLVWGIPVQD